MPLHPIYSLFFTIALFLAFTHFQRIISRSKIKVLSPWFNPVLLTIIVMILGLSLSQVSYDEYLKGAGLLTLLLYPATVSLAVPLYRNLPLLKRHAREILLGIIGGVLSNALIVPLLAKLFSLEEILTLSLLPKSITTPIGLILSEQIGGVPEITVPVIVITGTVGIVLGPSWLKLLKIQHPIAKGIALGTASHALGTSKAIEMGDIEGGMSGLAIGLSGILTAFIVPLLLQIF